MKSLYLVRHAKSSWKDTLLEDVKRPLKQRGKKNAAQLGEMLKKKREIPDLIISSPAKRALDTAKIIAKELKYPVKKIRKDERLYMAGEEEFIDVIGEVKKSVDRLMIVSHNFGITIFANRVSETELINIPTAGIVRTDFEMKKWEEIKRTAGKLVFFESPNTGKDKNGL